MRFVIGISALTLAASGVHAQPATPPTAIDRVCTTTTTVVKRGEQVLSTTSNTHCEDEGAKPGGHISLPAATGLLEALNKGPEMTPRSVRGDWRAVEPETGGVCHLFLTSTSGEGGLRARPTGCHGRLARVTAWRFDTDTVGLYAEDGGLVFRVSGDRDKLDGDGVSLDR